MDTIISIEETKTLGDFLKQQNKKVVLVGGCFDLLHFGHISLLEEAKKQGDVLVVLLESDKSIQRKKGNTRPLHTQRQRAHMLTSLKTVDYVLLLSDSMTNSDYEKVTKQLKPAIIATTRGSDSIRFIKKQAEEIHASIYLVDLIQNLSTSRIIDVLTKEI